MFTSAANLTPGGYINLSAHQGLFQNSGHDLNPIAVSILKLTIAGIDAVLYLKNPACLAGGLPPSVHAHRVHETSPYSNYNINFHLHTSVDTPIICLSVQPARFPSAFHIGFVHLGQMRELGLMVR